MDSILLGVPNLNAAVVGGGLNLHPNFKTTHTTSS